MASLEIGPLSTFLEDEEIASIRHALEQGGWPELKVSDDDTALIEGGLDDDMLADFMDQLEANEAGCDVYLPIEFEHVFEASGYRVGSAHTLLAALANMKDDLDISEDDENEAELDTDTDGDGDDDFEDLDDDDADLADDEPGAMELKDEHMRHLWRAFYKGASGAIASELVLRVQS